jgi:hypothetical protein
VRSEAIIAFAFQSLVIQYLTPHRHLFVDDLLFVSVAAPAGAITHPAPELPVILSPRLIDHSEQITFLASVSQATPSRSLVAAGSNAPQLPITSSPPQIECVNFLSLYSLQAYAEVSLYALRLGAAVVSATNLLAHHLGHTTQGCVEILTESQSAPLSECVTADVREQQEVPEPALQSGLSSVSVKEVICI